MAQFEGKTALVTGGTAGIGLAVVRRLAEEGAHVFVVGRRSAALDHVATELGEAVTTIRGDVGIENDVARIFDAVRERGALEIVFANAGGGEFAPLGAITWDHYANTFNSNVGGAINTVQGALPFLTAGASIILTGSSTDSKGARSFSVYAATKAAIRSLARSWAVELAEKGIRVNVVAPGPTGTPGLSGLAESPEQAEALLDGLAAGVPMRRLGTPDEIANAVVWLASPQSSFVTGAVLRADGGETQL
jgi:NAD(P)-dependent dehydrogenase (short-subunit alcohol dehydrogenase family)